MAGLGVTVLNGSESTVTVVTPDAVELSGRRELPSTVTIWTDGFGVPDPADGSGLSTDVLGHLVTDQS